jgi:hypothetical protein
MGLTMKEKKAVTRQIRSRYQKAKRKEKSDILNEFTQVTGYNRKYALRILNTPETTAILIFAKGTAVKPKPAGKKPSNRKGRKIYTDEVINSIRLIRAFFWYKCVGNEVSTSSWPPSSASRCASSPPGPRSALPPTSGKSSCPSAQEPAFAGETVDRALRKDKAALALKDIYAGLPFPLREFHSDNGSEFINQVITDWHRNPVCPIPFTRSRDHKKNDNCFVEQKNGAVVREYIGYARLEGESLQARLAAVYRSLVPLLNFFMPTMKLERKVKIGSKEIKKYDEPRSPYQRLPESEMLSPEVQAELTRLCRLYNPVQVQHNVNKVILALREAIAAQSPSSGKEPAA